MSAATAARPVALLRAAFLLPGLLAVILGLLGMHVLAGSHGMHGEAASAGSTATPTVLHSDAGVHTEHALSAPAPETQTPASVTIGGTEVPPSCVCQGGCAEKPAIHVGCTPSPAGATLGAPQPGAALPAARPWTAGQADLPSSYAYRPGTPSPNDLSISRT